MEQNTEFDELKSDEAFAALLSHAPPRATPPAEDESFVREAVHAEWQAVTGMHARRRRMTAFAMAASVVLAVVATFSITRVDNMAELKLASIDKQVGTIIVNSQAVADGRSIEVGDTVETRSSSGLALAWHDGGSLRVDENTAIVVEATNRVFLREGRVYFDSLAASWTANVSNTSAANLEIRTPYGLVRHLGTQFMARVADDELVVSVREGVVAISGDVQARATAGKQVAISESGTLTFDDTNGVDDWEWIESSSPAVNFDGRYISEALDWVSRETGRHVRYASAEARSVAQSARLRGIYDMAPSRALEVFMLASDLNARIEGEEIVISED